MRQVPINYSGPSIRSARYVQFKGVDMTTDPSKVDSSRSPFAPNLIADSGGFPEKRVGWRVLHQLEGKINGLFSLTVNDEAFFIAHVGDKLYQWSQDGQPTLIKEGINDGKSVAFTMEDKRKNNSDQKARNTLWLLTGNEYLSYDGEQVKDVTADAYIPTTTIARAPTGGGNSYENVNLLQPRRKNQFLADGTAVEFQLDTENIDAEKITVTVDDTEKTEGTDFTVDRTLGKITFVTAPPKPSTAGQDNIKVTFSKTVEGYADRIRKCTICTLYGLGTNDRVFLSGNSEYPSTDWHSELNDPTYIPDLSYSEIGGKETAIMGYHKIGEYLAIIKESNNQDITIFLRSAKLDTINERTQATFPLKQGIAGIGAVSKHCFGTLVDEPLFLSRTGIYGITSNTITAERTVQNRSYFVDPMLTKEEHLEDAICTTWNGTFIVCVNTNCYLLDGRQNKSYKPQSNGDYVYECYHWNNIPAVCFMEWKGNLYFGTAAGQICRFNNDMPLMDKYADNGEAITCYWSTKADDDGDFMSRKTMLKNGSGLMIKPYTRSGCDVLIRTEKDCSGSTGKLLRHADMDIFDWNDIDFQRFSFNTSDSPQVVPFKGKIRKYVTMQIIIKNSTKNEGFGVFGIIKRFSTCGYVKR